MADALSTNLDLHARLIAIAQKAVKQVKDNPAPNNALIPGDVPTSPSPDPPSYR